MMDFSSSQPDPSFPQRHSNRRLAQAVPSSPTLHADVLIYGHDLGWSYPTNGMVSLPRRRELVRLARTYDALAIAENIVNARESVWLTKIRVNVLLVNGDRFEIPANEQAVPIRDRI